MLLAEIFFLGVLITALVIILELTLDSLIAFSSSSLSIIFFSLISSIKLDKIFFALLASSPSIKSILPLALILRLRDFSIYLIFLSLSPKRGMAIELSSTSKTI